MSQAKGGSVKVNGDAVRHARVNQAMTVEELAKKAGYSKRSIENLQNGSYARLSTISTVADALGVTYQSLLAEPYTEPAPFSKPLSLSIVLNLSFQNFDAAESLDKLVGVIERLTSSKDGIKVISVTESSVIVDMEMEEEDATRLVVIFPRFREIASEIVQQLPDHVALMEMVNAVTELRIRVNQPPRGDAPPAAPPKPPMSQEEQRKALVEAFERDRFDAKKPRN